MKKRKDLWKEVGFITLVEDGENELLGHYRVVDREEGKVIEVVILMRMEERMVYISIQLSVSVLFTRIYHILNFIY